MHNNPEKKILVYLVSVFGSDNVNMIVLFTGFLTKEVGIAVIPFGVEVVRKLQVELGAGRLSMSLF